MPRLQLARRVLLALCGLLAIWSVVAAPVNVAPEKLLDDLADGHVRQVSAACPGDRGVPGITFRFGNAPFADDPLICWLSDIGLTYQATLRGPLDYDDRGLVTPAGNLLADDVEATVQATADAEDVALPLVDGELSTQGWYRLLAESLLVLILILAVAVVFVGPQPRRFTRFGTCWIVLLTPLLLGVAWWLVREVPWSRQALAMQEPDGRQTGVPEGGTLRRRGGWTGLLVALVAVVLVNAVGFGLRPLLAGSPDHDPGDWVVTSAHGPGQSGD